MKVNYFEDTDTALVAMGGETVTETLAINENTSIDLDEKGSLVSMTIEHAKQNAGLMLPQAPQPTSAASAGRRA